MRIYKALGALLTYPDETLLASLDEIAAEIAAAGVLPAPVRRQLDRLIADLRAADPLDAQAAYVQLFDRSRALSLHLYEHVHGDSRDRGQAMVNLRNLYRFHGLELGVREMPDYLPLVCEFLSLVDPAVARSILADAGHILEALRRRLEARGSAYAAVFAALGSLAGAEADRGKVNALLAAEPEDPDDLAALDRTWEEAAVTFGQSAALDSCPAARPAAGAA